MAWNPQILRHKTAVMHRIQLLAARGYRHYVAGECRNSRIADLGQKFCDNYGVGASKIQRARAKCAGRANTFLFVYPKPETTDWLWWLLATDGDGPVHSRERLKAVAEPRSRLSWISDYEMVLHMRAGRAQPSITWRMKRSLYQSWHVRIRAAIRARDTDTLAKQALFSLYRSPGFAGIRAQVWRLSELFRREWSRSRRSSECMPTTRALGFVRARQYPTIPLQVVVKRMQDGLSPFPRKAREETAMSRQDATC
jgi:hypothetical protein